MSTDSQPTVSIIVPNYNGGALFHNCVKSLEQLDYHADRLQVVLVDDASTDGTGRWLQTAGLPKHFQRVWHGDNRGRSAARNTGLRWATGEVVILLDGDLTVKPDFVTAHLEALLRPGVVAVAGQVTAGPNVPRTRVVRYLYEYTGRGARQFGEHRPLPFQFLLTNNMSLRRETLAEAGPFDESFKAYGGEDTLFALRIWRRHPRGLRYAAQPLAFDHDTPALSTLLRKFGSYGEQNLGRLIAEHPDTVPALHADWVVGPRTKRLRGRILFNPLMCALVRGAAPLVPYPLSNYAIRHLLGAQVIRGLRRQLSRAA